MVDVDGMVGWLVKLMQDANLALCYCRSSKDGRAELVFVDGLRTAERKEDAARLYLLEGLGIELRIAAKGVVKGILVFGKGRRVEDDKVVLK